MCVDPFTGMIELGTDPAMREGLLERIPGIIEFRDDGMLLPSEVASIPDMYIVGKAYIYLHDEFGLVRMLVTRTHATADGVLWILGEPEDVEPINVDYEFGITVSLGGLARKRLLPIDHD